MVMMPLGPALMQNLNITPQQFSLLVSSYSISAGIVALLSASFVDRYCRKKLLLFVYAGFTLGTFACGLAFDFYYLMGARIVAGAFGGIAGTLLLSIVGDLVSYERRASAVSTVTMGFQLAAAFGVPFGIYFGAELGWQSAFLLVGSISLVIFVIIWKVLPSMTGHLNKPVKASILDAFRGVIARPNQLRALLFIVVVLMGQFVIIPFLSPFMVSNIGFKEVELTYIYLTGGIVSFIAYPIIGKLADRFSKQRVFYILVLISLIPLYLITNLNTDSKFYALFCNSLFFIFVGGRMIPANTLVISTAEPESRASFLSIRSAVMHLGSGISATVAGLIIFQGPTGQFINYDIVGYLAIGMSLLSLLLMRKIKVVS